MFSRPKDSATVSATALDTDLEKEATNSPKSTFWYRLSTRKKALFITTVAILTLGLALGLGLGLGLPRGTSAQTIVRPRVNYSWDLVLGYRINPAQANSSIRFYDVDLFGTSPQDMQALSSAGHYVSCYFSAGTREDWRPDAESFPQATIGNNMTDWEGEAWVDTRSNEIRDIMLRRIQLAKDKGCQGIDGDNLDAYDPDNNAGFPLTEDDGVDFVLFLANAAHTRGLAYGLKNAGAILDRVLSVSDWVINEECVAFGECDVYAPFITAGKPVFHVEYTENENDTDFQEEACAAGGHPDFSTIIKHMDLNEWVVTC